ncbi:hypothetical protein [Methylobacterium sp. J-030]|uniref:hypothetical protein n=1 Tax=Methylobacterium sp. J-030 TaxID=2836627 RepID=UPI001FB8F102|nr:hypothetical protein [Methylobacterium sp. J-030]
MGEAFRHEKNCLEGIISELPFLLDSAGNVLRRHRPTVRMAVGTARYLIAIEREQTAGQLDMLDERLRNPRRGQERPILKAA